MARVTGIGGFFFRARDPDALNRWYAEHFGVVMLDATSYDDPGWFQDRGETVVSAFAPDSDSFGSPDKTWKLNLRVDDLDGVVNRLRAAGVTAEPHAEDLSERPLRGARGPGGQPDPALGAECGLRGARSGAGAHVTLRRRGVPARRCSRT